MIVIGWTRRGSTGLLSLTLTDNVYRVLSPLIVSIQIDSNVSMLMP